MVVCARVHSRVITRKTEYLVHPNERMKIAMSRQRARPGLENEARQKTRRRKPVSYTHLRAHETSLHLVCRLLLEKKNRPRTTIKRGGVGTIRDDSNGRFERERVDTSRSVRCGRRREPTSASTSGRRGRRGRRGRSRIETREGAPRFRREWSVGHSFGWRGRETKTNRGKRETMVG